MKHEEVEARNLVELYVGRKLSGEEAASFEDHFADCPQCQDNIEATERFRRGLKAVSRAAPKKASRWRWSVAAAAILASGLAGWQAWRAETLKHELSEARLSRLELKRQYERGAEQKPDVNRPLVAATYLLNTTRSGEVGAPVNRIPLGTSSHWVVLSLDRDLEIGFESLRAELVDASERRAWAGDALPYMAGVPVSMVLPSTLLRAGDYSLTVEGRLRNGEYRSIGRYRFRVLPE